MWLMFTTFNEYPLNNLLILTSKHIVDFYDDFRDLGIKLNKFISDA